MGQSCVATQQITPELNSQCRELAIYSGLHWADSYIFGSDSASGG